MAFTNTQTDNLTFGSASSIAHPYPVNPANGSLLAWIFFLRSDTVTVTSITDTLGNTWAVRAPVAPASGLGAGGERPWIAAAYCPTGGANTVTANLSGAIGASSCLLEFAGGPTSLIVDQTTSGNNAASVPSMTLTGVAANALVLGAFVSSAGMTVGAGFTAARNSGDNWNELAEYILDHGAAGNRTVDATPSSQWTGTAVSFALTAAAANYVPYSWRPVMLPIMTR